jgi:hypothetical protein
LFHTSNIKFEVQAFGRDKYEHLPCKVQSFTVSGVFFVVTFNAGAVCFIPQALGCSSVERLPPVCLVLNVQIFWKQVELECHGSASEMLRYVSN